MVWPADQGRWVGGAHGCLGGSGASYSTVLLRPWSSFSTRRWYDRRDVDSSWRHLYLGGQVCRLRMRRRRLACPEHGVITEAVPFARAGARFTRDFEDLVVWLVTRSDKCTEAAFARVAWRTVGAICERVAAEKLDGDLDHATVVELLDRWCSRAQRSRIPEFVKAARTIRTHRDGITAAVDRHLTNGRHEGRKNKVRTMINRAYGFHTAEAALALIMLACGPVKLELPYHT